MVYALRVAVETPPSPLPPPPPPCTHAVFLQYREVQGSGPAIEAEAPATAEGKREPQEQGL